MSLSFDASTYSSNTSVGDFLPARNMANEKAMMTAATTSRSRMNGSNPFRPGLGLVWRPLDIDGITGGCCVDI
jgi:hypothetical protein